MPTRSPACATKPGRARATPTRCTRRWSRSASSPTARRRRTPAGRAGSTSSPRRVARRDSRPSDRLAPISACGSPPSAWRRCATSIPMRSLQPVIDAPAECAEGFATRDEALRELLRARLGGLGPATAESLAAPLGLARGRGRARPARAAGRRLRAAGPLHAAAAGRCRRRVVRAAPARAHPSLHAQAPAPRDRAGRAARLRRASCSTGSASARPAASAAPTRWPACSASSKASRRRRRCGKRRSCRRACRTTPARGSTSCARPGARCGRACARWPSEGRAAGASLRSTPVLLLPRRAAPLWTRLAPNRADDAEPRLARAPGRRAPRRARRVVLRRDRRRRPPAAGRARGRARRARRPRPRQLRQLRRPARAARSGGEAIVGARAPAPRRHAARASPTRAAGR